MGDGKHAGGRESGAKTVRRAILFELEYVAVAGRQIKFDTMKAALKGTRVDLSLTAFSRYCLHRSAKAGVEALLASAGKSAASAEVLERYQAGIAEAFSDGGLKVDAAYEAILKVVRKHNLRMGVLSSLDAATTEALSRKLDLASHGAVMFTISANDQRAYSGDHWMHLARRVETAPRRCVTICTQSDSCQAALAARMRCIVRPDAYTAFQDFSGADSVTEHITPAVIELVLDVKAE